MTVRSEGASEKPNIEGKTLEGYVRALRKQVNYWGDRHASGLYIVQAYTLFATLIMAVNLALKENIKHVGGWVPFCLAAAALTIIATFFANSQKSEEPYKKRMSCLEGMAKCNRLLRELQSKKDWNDRKRAVFLRRVEAFECDYATLLARPPKIHASAIGWVMLAMVVVFYLVYEFYHVGAFRALIGGFA